MRLQIESDGINMTQHLLFLRIRNQLLFEPPNRKPQEVKPFRHMDSLGFNLVDLQPSATQKVFDRWDDIRLNHLS